MQQAIVTIFTISNTKATEHGIAGLKTLHKVAASLDGLRFDFQYGADLLQAIVENNRQRNIAHIRKVTEEQYRLNFEINEGGVIRTEHVTLTVNYVSSGGLVKLGEITLILNPVAKKYFPDMTQDRFEIKGLVDMVAFEEAYREKGRFPEVVESVEAFKCSKYANTGAYCLYDDKSDTFSVIMPFSDDIGVVRLYKPK